MNRTLTQLRSGPASRALQAVAVLLMLLLCATLGPRASGRAVQTVLAAAAAATVLLRPQWGLVGLIPACLVVDYALGTGTQTEVPAALLLLALMGGVWLLRMARARALRLAPGPANAPWLALVAAAGLSLLTGNALWNPWVQTKGNFLLVQVAQLSVFMLSAVAFGLVAQLAPAARTLRAMVTVFLALGGLYIGARWAGGSELARRLFPPGATGSLFWVWLVSLAAGQALFHRGLGAGSRLALWLLVGASFSVGWLLDQSWVAGWAPPLVALLVVLFLRSVRLGVVSTAGLALGMRFVFPGFYRNVMLTAIETGSFLRIPAWVGVAQLVGNRWPIGLGLAAYWHYWRDLLHTWVWSPRNVVQLTAGQGVNSHNNFVDIFAQMGLIGLAAFAWLAVALWRQGWAVRRTVPDGFERGYVYGCLGGLVGTLAAGMLADWFLPFVYNVGLPGMRSSLLAWLFLGGMAALAQTEGRQEALPGSA